MNSDILEELWPTSNSSLGAKMRLRFNELNIRKQQLIKPKSISSCDLLQLPMVGYKKTQNNQTQYDFIFKTLIEFVVNCGKHMKGTF